MRERGRARGRPREEDLAELDPAGSGEEALDPEEGERGLGALLRLCRAGEEAWARGRLREVADGLLSGIGGGAEAAEAALLELVRSDCPSGMDWALSRGAGMAAPEGISWIGVCLGEGFAPRALRDLARRGALEGEAREWGMRESGEGHPILMAATWGLVLRRGFEEGARAALEGLDLAGFRAERSVRFRRRLAELALEGSLPALERCDREGVDLAEFGEAGREMALSSLLGHLRGSRRAEGWPAWSERLDGRWAGAFEPRAPAAALLEAALGSLESGLWSGWFAGTGAEGLARRIPELAAGKFGGLSGADLSAALGRTTALLAGRAPQERSDPDWGWWGLGRSRGDERRDGEEELHAALLAAASQPRRAPRGI